MAMAGNTGHRTRVHARFNEVFGAHLLFFRVCRCRASAGSPLVKSHGTRPIATLSMMDDLGFVTNDRLRRPNPEETSEESKVASLYAAAAARIVVISKRSFTTAYGAKSLTAEVITLAHVLPDESVALEASLESLIGDPSQIDTTPQWSTTHAAGAIFDPDVLLAWLLAQGVSGRH